MINLKRQKTHMTFNGIFHIAFMMLLLSFFIFSSHGYGSTDIPAKVNTTPVAIGADALFTGFGGGSGLANKAIFTVVNEDMGPIASSTLVTGFHVTEANVYTKSSNISTVNGTTQTAPPCEDICILSM